MKKVQKVVFGKRFKYVYKNMDSIKNWVGFEPKVNIKDGIKLFVKWYKNYLIK